MESMDRIRAFFSKPQGDEGRITAAIARGLAAIDARKQGTVVGARRADDYQALFEAAAFPAGLSSEDEVLDRLAGLYDGVGIWAHPQTQVNVVPPPTTVSIAAAAFAARYNENSIWEHYGTSAARSEVLAIGMLADLIGFDKQRAGGIFTFGGTGCNLYGARIGIEKAAPNARAQGLREPVQFYCSDVAHYSVKSAAIWTGVGTDNVRVIASTEDNALDLRELERTLQATVDTGGRIGTLFATMGTTDAFGIDPLRQMAELRDEFQAKVGYRIHLHADAVIGWPYLTFQGDAGIDRLPEPLREEVRTIVARITELRYADSVGIDFHKTGWAPYLCSAFVVRDRDDLLLLRKEKKEMPYLYHGSGYQPGIFTLESSRPNYAQKALANMLLLGREGYETLIVHLLQMADYLRAQLDASDDTVVLNRNNPAFVTDFRLYPGSKLDVDGRPLFEKELHDLCPEEYTEQINTYNRAIAARMIERAATEGTSLISYTDSYKSTHRGRMLVALKSYPMSPFTDEIHMDRLLHDLCQAKREVDAG